MTEQTSRPKYLQVADDLRRAIRSGTYPVGSELPSTSQLVRSHEVSTTVVRAAVRELRQEGIVRGQPGKAVYVTATPDEVPSSGAGAEDIMALVRDLQDRVARLEQQVGDVRS
ncbi:winged helix-turn-helix transcriptional regulator [Pseudonocardia sp. EV170527-09]|uniref:winged helix-turn-helix domain-containing protein n=1 Tax=Pseudonocardia sp. EV170527-09 TaxID=2603411 RepID=UPI0011F3E6CF|nr:winged helix-turn-helix domain-containing protein [Pseudonocardia sp. EV170527-09]KAA1019033.1 winged helix-turn-helix transcriptional regulator [Pseudonocardia sp. EV170527-09]